jgi:hypothetical protein
MGKELACAQKPDESGGKRYRPLFGKYPVCKVTVIGEHISMHIGEENVIAVARLAYREDSGFSFYADLSSSQEGSLGLFKEIYRDAKEHFRKKGVSIDGFVDEADKKAVAHFLSTTTLLGSQKKKPIAPEEEMEMTRRMSIAVDEYLRAHYPMVEEELVDCGVFGGMTRGTKIWTPKEGLYVAMEAPLADNSPWSVNMQVNCDEKPDLHELIGLRDQIEALLKEKFPEYVDSILTYDANHQFWIHLHELGRKHQKIEKCLETLMIE